MPTFKVFVKEEHFQEVTIEATDERDAVMKVREGEGTYGECKFHATCSDEEWHVEK